MDDITLAASPGATAAQLRDIAERTPKARALVAVHPQAYPALLEWLGSLGDPEVDAALRSRPGAGDGAPGEPALAPTPAPRIELAATPVRGARRRRGAPIAIGVVAGLLLAGGAAALLVPRLGGGEDSNPPAASGVVDSGGDAEVAAADTEPATFLDGAALSWTVYAADLLPLLEDGIAAFDVPLESDEVGLPMWGGIVEAGNTWIVGIGYSSGGEGMDALPLTTALMGLDSATGERLWQLDEAMSDCIAQESGVIVACTAWQSGDTVALDPRDGTEVWRVGTSGDALTSGDTLVIQDLGGISAFDFATGQELWTFAGQPLGSETLFLQVRGQLVTTSLEDRDVILDLASGEVIAEGWPVEVALIDDRAIVSALPYVDAEITVYDPGRVSVLEDMDSSPDVVVEGEARSYWTEYSDSTVWARDPETEMWLWETSPDLWPAPVDRTISRHGTDRIVVRSRSGVLTLVPDGEGMGEITRWSLPAWVDLPDNTWVPLGVNALNDGVVTVSQSGRLAAFDGFTGEDLWEMDIPGAVVSDGPRGELAVVSQDRTQLSRIVPAQSEVSNAVVLPDEMPNCPGDTILLARAELVNGWVLVCGYYADEPTYFAVHTTDSAEGFVGDLVSESVTYDESLGRYTAALPDGSVLWLDHTPATLGLRSSAGATSLQESVLYIFFVELGEGGAAQGVGDYGVAAPDRTADSQVEYFSEILQRSEDARAELGPAVAAVRDCSVANGDYSEQIATIASVRDNRAELLAAIQAAPVDLVPDGTQLVDELSAALTASYNADVAYLEAAEYADTYGCDPSAGDFGAEYTEQAATTKTIFAEHWNSVIAPEFGVPTVSRETL